MEEIKLSPQELKEAIDLGKLIGSGFFSRVFTYKGRLIKLDARLYDMLKDSFKVFAEKRVNERYEWQKKDFDSREQLEELEKRQPYIRPRVPEGIVTLKDVDSSIKGISPGIILAPFLDYRKMDQMSKQDYKLALILLRQLFTDVTEMADQKIAHEDLFHCEDEYHLGDKAQHDYNILYKGNDPQIIDMSRKYVKVGKDFQGTGKMYRQLARIIDDYRVGNGLESVYDDDKELTEADLAKLITDFDIEMRRKK